MFKFIARLILRKFAEPVVDCLILIMQELADNTDTGIDDAIVEQLKNYKAVIVRFLLSNIDNIIDKKI